MNIPFNKPYLTGKEAHYIYEAVYTNRHIAGNGNFTKKCQNFFEKRFGFKKSLLTTSCTDALEMSAILIDTKRDDEIIMPSYTFVTTANAFVSLLICFTYLFTYYVCITNTLTNYVTIK